MKPSGSASAGRLEGIQLLRALAALAVVFIHSITRISVTFPDKAGGSLFLTMRGNQWTFGDAGVDIFFVISGFIMLYVHAGDFGKAGAVGEFLRRRVLRIAPIYWLLTSLGVALLVAGPDLFGHPRGGLDLAWIAGSYLFLPLPSPEGPISPVLGVGWTLNYEFFFYGLFAVALLMPRKPGLLGLGAVLCALVIAGTILRPTHPTLTFLTSWLLLDFLGGVAIAWWVLAGGRLDPLTRRAFLGLGLFALAVTVYWPPHEAGPARFLAWGFPAMLVVLALYDRPLPRHAGGRLLRLLGDASYSIYLFQVFALPGWAKVMAKLGLGILPFELAVLVLVALVTASGVVCWYVLERPLGRLLRDPRPRPAPKLRAAGRPA
ncbi:acyltransferase [Aureimonas endophytica]|uniref:Acyltransferase n=1 Tax=Aureimonas endophytica TaxID=2027858 RepID=A0A916ZGZ6_9HYPH|nr:acyltransferase [Aureimonas endophytica]GGD97238.1 acyltransferase [Aureimonas endophytica]